MKALEPWSGLLDKTDAPDDYIFRMNYVTGANVTYGEIRKLTTTHDRINKHLEG
jgi:hypothetical protein